jgi:signal transduction histidine kinase
LANQLTMRRRLFLDIIQRNSKRIGDLITELLDTSRPTEMTFERTTLQASWMKASQEALDRITLQHIHLRVRYADQALFPQRQ